MKKLFGLWLLLSICSAQVIIAQTYDDGIQSYRAAYAASLVNETQGEQENLEEAYRIFEPLAKNDTKSLIMYYFLSIKLGKPFLLEEPLFQYIKKNHDNFIEVEQIPFSEDHKTIILTALNNLAEQNENQAIKLLEEAKNDAGLEEYDKALVKLQQVEKLWDIDEVPTLKINYTRLDKEKKKALIVDNVKDLCSRGLYKDALDDLINNKGVLAPQVFNQHEEEIKKKWAEKILTEANKKLKNKEYDEAIRLSMEAYNIYPLNEAQELKSKAEKRKNKAIKKSPHAGFSIFGDYGSFGQSNLTNTDLFWNGYINQYAALTDTNTLRTEPVDDSKNKYTYSLGMIGMFSRSVGLMASIGFLKQQLNVFSDYRFTWTWNTGGSASNTRSMIHNANISLNPVSLDLLTAIDLKNGMLFKLYAGPTLFLTNIDFRTYLGYGGVWVYNNHPYPEWFPFEYVIQSKKKLFGGNGGVDLEYKYTAFSSFCLGFQYFWIPPQTYDLLLISQHYQGQIWGNTFAIGDPYDLPNLPDYQVKLNLSFYKFFLGIRLYL